MKTNSLHAFCLCMLSLFGLNTLAQTEVNALAEIASLPEGTNVQVNLKDVHTSISNYDFWADATTLYMQDESAGVSFKGLTDIEGGKTLNGTIQAVTENVNGVMALSVTEETNTSNVTQSDWDYTGTPVTTIADIESGKQCYMLVTLKDVTAKPSEYSSYAVTLSDGTNTIELYNDWDLVQLSKIPENVKSITALVFLDVWNGGYYLIPIRQDLIIDADATDDAKSVKTLAGLSDVADGDEVLVTLTDTYVTASLGDAAVLEDATAGSLFYGLSVAAGKVLNGKIYATATKVGNDICLKANSEKTNLDEVTMTEGTKTATPVYLNGALSPYWHNRLIVLTDLQSTQTDEVWTLSQNDVTMTMKDAFGQLEGYDVPTYIKSLTGIVLYDTTSEGYVVAPVSKDLIVEGSAPVELTGIAKVKTMANGEDFSLDVENAQVTFAEEDEYGCFYIIEDETGGLMLQEFPNMGWVPGDRISGTINATLNRERADAYYTDVAAVANSETTTEPSDFDVLHGYLTPSIVTCEEAKTGRYYSCYVLLDHVYKTTATMTFMGYDIENTAVDDGTGTILFDDGWAVLPSEWYSDMDICQLPDGTTCLAGIIEPMFNRDFIYPLSVNDVLNPTNIQTIETAESSKIYNLMGQRIGHLQKGINILNGKKVILN